MTVVRPSFPPQPSATSWPGVEWPGGGLPAVAERLADCVARWQSDPDRYGLHLALVMVHRGRLVAESYGATADAGTALVSWSMAKSVVHALVGVCVRDGLLALDQPAPVVEWAGDERRAITIEQLLAMTSGLHFVEDYVDDGVSDVIDMLFGTGIDDVAGFAIGKPLDHPPGTSWNYSSGTSNILARIVGDVAAALHPDRAREDAMRAFLADELFTPLAMASADPRFDTAGTFVASSFLYATARDFARFGYLYLRDGTWDGRRILPVGWADHARTPAGARSGAVVPTDETFGYGHHWWLWNRQGLPAAFGAHGYENQLVVVDPTRDLVLVRLAKTPAALQPNVLPDLVALIGAVPLESVPTIT